MGTAADSLGSEPEDIQIVEQEDQEPPSRDELYQIIQDQAERIDDLEQRIQHLEYDIDDVETQSETVEDVAEQFKNGKIGGPAGADFIRDFADVPSTGSLIDARAKKLYFTIIEERRLGKPVPSDRVVTWLGLGDSSNPSVQAKRVMERLEQHREDGFLLGDIHTGKYRGKNCIWVNRTED